MDPHVRREIRHLEEHVTCTEDIDDKSQGTSVVYDGVDVAAAKQALGCSASSAFRSSRSRQAWEPRKAERRITTTVSKADEQVRQPR